MDARGSRFKKLFSISPFKIGIAITLAVIVLYFLDFPFLKFMELKALDLRMTSRGERLPGVETVIAAIDEKSLKELGRWPWSRSTMARLVNALKKYEARAVGLDMDFSEPDSNASLKDMAAIQKEAERLGIADSRLNDYIEEKKMKADRDADLAAALQDAGNVTLGFFFHTAKREIEHLTNKEIEEGAGEAFGFQIPGCPAQEYTRDFHDHRGLGGCPEYQIHYGCGTEQRLFQCLSGQRRGHPVVPPGDPVSR